MACEEKLAQREVAAYIAQQNFIPAEHRAGCVVPQWVEFPLAFI